MPVNESLEYFPLFDPETEAETPAVSAAIGSRIAAIGTPDALGGAGAIVVYMYSEEKNAWGYVGVMAGAKISGSEQVRTVGSSLAAFGDTLIVGASGDKTTPGRVFVLTPPYGTWSYSVTPVVAELSYPKSAPGDGFGQAVAHCQDGTDDYVAVGAPGAPPPIGATGPGQVFVFKGLRPSSEPWNTSPIANPSPEGADSDRFATSVAINMSGDGAGGTDGTVTIAVGAPGAREGEGSVYVARTSEAGNWTSPFKLGEPLVPSFPFSEDFKTQNYGAAVALTGGSLLAVGAPNDPNFEEEIEDTGAVWLYQYADGGFVPVEPRLYGPTASGNFGGAVAFPETAPGSRAGSIVVGGAGAGPGSAYRFVAGDEGYTADKELASLPGKPGNRFGAAVAASEYQHGSWSLVAAPGVAKAGQEGGGFVYAESDQPPRWMDIPALVTSPPIRWGGLAPDWWKKFTPEIARYL
jgi:hypothetical protein